MSAPIAHIFLAVQILAGPLANKFDDKIFIVGTSFPDIRYLKCTERSETHFEYLNWNDVITERDSFIAGMKFHSFVDLKTEEFRVKSEIYKKLPDFRFITQSIKFAEDIILTSVFDVKEYRSYFNQIYSEERNYKISDQNIEKWHEFLRKYFNKEYSTHDLIMKYFDLHEPNAFFIKRWFFSWFYARKINNTIKLILADKNIKDLILNFYLNFSNSCIY